MKNYIKKILVTILFFQIFNLNAQEVLNYQCIKSATKEVANQEIKNIYKYIDKNAKVLVLPFYSETEEFTEMSVSISMDLTDALQLVAQDKNKQITFFYPEEYSKKGNSIVAETNVTINATTEYWTSLITKFNPDFFIEGYYFIEKNNDGTYILTLKNINVKSNDTKNTTVISKLALSSVSKPITESELINDLKTSDSYFINSEELEKKKKKQIIKSKLKSSLTNSNYTVELTKDAANYEIKIVGTSREFNNVNGIYFSYVDVNFTVIDLKTTKTIYDNNYTEKGSSMLSYADAAQKAYETISKTVLTELTDFIQNK